MVLTALAALTVGSCAAEPFVENQRPPDVDLGQLVGFEIIDLEIDGVSYPVALANTASLRRQGLRAVSDLGDIIGMWFTWGGDEVDSAFTMKDTLIALDIAFFDAGGRVVDTFTMVPCTGSDCPLYRSSGPYVGALEVPADGRLDLDTDTVITLP